MNYYVAKVLRKLLNPPAVKNSKLDPTARADVGSIVVESSMGKHSYVGEYTSLICTKVGAFTSISNYCAIGGGAHPIDWVSDSPVFNTTGGILKEKLAHLPFDPYRETVIGNDVWIGSHCLIRAGVTIGNGAVIGMGSVVTRNVGAYEIWAGNPARMLRRRFDEETAMEIEKTQWWLAGDETLKAIGNRMNDVQAFLRAYACEQKNTELDEKRK